MKGFILLALFVAAVATASRGDTVFVEAEGFAERGGWVLDQQFIEVMGSPYLLAHGLGVPVEDAKATVPFPAPGEYHVFVRTKNWVPGYGGADAPGRFQLLIDGTPLKETFGTRSGWQRSESSLPALHMRSALHST